MNRIKVKGNFSVEELKERMISSKDMAERKRWQALYLAKTGKYTVKEIADIIKVSVYTINKWVYNFNHKGEEGIKSHKKGGNHSSFLSWQEEKDFLAELKRKAESGILLTVKNIKAELEKKLGHTVSKDYPYDLLHRHKWQKTVYQSKKTKQNNKEQ